MAGHVLEGGRPELQVGAVVALAREAVAIAWDALVVAISGETITMLAVLLAGSRSPGSTVTLTRCDAR